MSIFIGNKKSTLFKGDYRPAQLYRGNKKFAGYTEKTFSGQNLAINGAYNDLPSEITINGGFVPSKNLFDISAASSDESWSSGLYTYARFLPFTFKKGVHYTISMSDNLCWKDRYPFGSGNSVAMVVNSKNAWGGKVIGNSTLAYQTPTAINIYNETEDTYLVLYTSAPAKKEIFETLFPNFQIEMGSAATEYEPYITPANPVLIWDGEEIEVPYVLYKGDSIRFAKDNKSENVTLYNAQGSTDISDTEFGQKLLSLKTLPKTTTASISEGSLKISALVSD